MKRILLTWLLLAGLVFAQQQPANPITTQQVTLPVFTLNPSPVVNAAVQLTGNPGPKTIYYWIVANFPVGSTSPSGPFLITGAPNTLSVSNFVSIIPQYPQGATSVDVLKTSINVAPSGACGCAVATGVTGGVINDQSDATGAYTVNPVNINALGLSLQNEVQSASVSHLILRQNGVFVADLSIVGSGSVTSVALTAPAEFSVAGSPVTSFGTLAISKANQAANTVWAGPTSGGAAPPTFRALATGDVPAGTVSVFRNWHGWAALGRDGSIAFTYATNPQTGGLTVIHVDATATEPTYERITTAAAGGSSATVLDNSGEGAGSRQIPIGILSEYRTRVRLSSIAQERIWIGLSNQTSGGATFQTDTPNIPFVGFRYSSAAESTYQCVAQTSSIAQTVTDTAVTVDTNGHTFRLTKSGSNVVCSIDGTATATMSSNLPAAGTLLAPIINIDNIGLANTKTADIAYSYWETNP